MRLPEPYGSPIDPMWNRGHICSLLETVSLIVSLDPAVRKEAIIAFTHKWSGSGTVGVHHRAMAAL